MQTYDAIELTKKIQSVDEFEGAKLLLHAIHDGQMQAITDFSNKLAGKE